MEMPIKSFKTFLDEMSAGGAGPTNTAGGGQVAGIGVGPQGEPGVDLRKNRKKRTADPRLPMGMSRRKKVG